MKNSINYITYEKALTDNEILLYGQIIDKFKNGEINFQQLEKSFSSIGVIIVPRLVDFSKKKMTRDMAKNVKERLHNKAYIYSDIHDFILNSDKFKDVIFVMNYKAIEVLADNGIKEYQKTLLSILEWQLHNSFKKDEKWAIKRAKWQRRIIELEKELSKSNQNGKTK